MQKCYFFLLCMAMLSCSLHKLSTIPVVSPINATYGQMAAYIDGHDEQRSDTVCTVVNDTQERLSCEFCHRALDGDRIVGTVFGPHPDSPNGRIILFSFFIYRSKTVLAEPGSADYTRLMGKFYRNLCALANVYQ